MSELFKGLRLFITHRDSQTRLDIDGELDLATVEALREHLDFLVASGAGDVDIDMELVTFCDSTSLTALLTAHRQLATAGRRVRIVNASPQVARLLQIVALDTTLLSPDGADDRAVDGVGHRRPRPPQVTAGRSRDEEGALDADPHTHHGFHG